MADLDGIEHTIEVEAESLYLAAAKVLAALRRSPMGGDWPAGLAPFRIVNIAPEPVNTVTVPRLVAWAEKTGGNPAEISDRPDARKILGLV